MTPRTLCAVLALIVVVEPMSSAWALTPQSPEVRQAVERARAFLMQQKMPSARGGKDEPGPEVGTVALVALALVKSHVENKDPPIRENPIVQQAVSEVRAAIGNGSIGQGYPAIYNLGVSIVFLSALDKAAYRNDIAAAVKILTTFQLPNGGFASRPRGSLSAPGGDTSMTQYAVLGLWEASQAGVGTPPGAWQNITKWLLDTQKPDGTFIYHPPSSQPASTPHSMTAGGVGSLYICANYARPHAAPKEPPKKKDDDVPSALKPAGAKKEKEKEKEPARGKVSFDMARLEAGMSRADQWLEQNFTVQLTRYELYYLYALERYYAFREEWERERPPEPDWYTQGATHLLKTQQNNGFWQGSHDAIVSTSFGILFLVRSTKISLGIAGPEGKAGGTLLSGVGLPSDLTQIRVQNGQVKARALSGPADELLEILENPDDPKFLQALEGLDELIMKADYTMLSPHVARLKEMIKSESPEARAVAVTGLGKERNLDSVPTLIYALGDNEVEVIAAAHDALRFVSRKVDGFGFKPQPLKDDKAKLERAQVIEKWKKWYRSVRPDADFEN